MALLDLHWRSNVLQKHVGAYVIVPDNAKPPFATFYLLHGLSDDYTIWLRRTSIERYAEAYPMMIVMPDGFRGFYTDNFAGPAYGKYIGEELVAFIDRMFPTKKSRNGRVIGGLSMGGYGSFRLALAYPDTFCSVTSHSGALMRGNQVSIPDDQAEFQRVLSSSPRGSHHDLVNLVKKCKKAGKLPKMRIDCGTDDFLLQDNREYHAILQKLDVPHEYEEFPGAHTWEYWDRHVQTALKFHAKNLKLK